MEGSVRHRPRVDKGKAWGNPIRACNADIDGEENCTEGFIS